MGAFHVDLPALPKPGWFEEVLTSWPLALSPAKIQPESHLEQTMKKALDSPNIKGTLWVHGRRPIHRGTFHILVNSGFIVRPCKGSE
jgi:hypothetical protein